MIPVHGATSKFWADRVWSPKPKPTSEEVPILLMCLRCFSLPVPQCACYWIFIFSPSYFYLERLSASLMRCGVADQWRGCSFVLNYVFKLAVLCSGQVGKMNSLLWCTVPSAWVSRERWWVMTVAWCRGKEALEGRLKGRVCAVLHVS